MICSLLAAAIIQLPGVTGENLRARAFFDANNVKVGDPLTLTVDFLGNADFQALHPPELSGRVDSRDWKIYDDSAKTDTYRDARRLTYRVRPMRKGVLWFPALEFGYSVPGGGTRTVKANAIPVHAKSGSQVVVEEMDEAGRMPDPDALVLEPAVALSDDEAFAWRKACAKPTAEAFSAFDFPEARLNEARCAVLEGNWARALKLYSVLEWRLGQTPAIERGIVAALARKYENPQAELPVWRQVGRPVLRYPWYLRAAIVIGAFALVALVFRLLGKVIRMAACIAVSAVMMAQSSSAQGIFQQMEEEMERMHRQMRQSMGGGLSFGFGQGQEKPVKITVSVETSVSDIRVGDEFDFIVSLDAPRSCSIGQVSLVPSERFGMTLTGQVRNLEDGKSVNPSNVVKRLAVPVRYDVPFSAGITFTVNGMVTRRESRRRGGFFSFTSSTSFRSESAPVKLDVKPLPSAGQPSDYAGVVSADMALRERLDIDEVETNDVIRITYEMRVHGYVPAEFLPEGAAFEMNRDSENGIMSYRRFFIADGTNLTPRVEIPYYDPESKSYRRAACGGTPVRYKTGGAE